MLFRMGHGVEVTELFGIGTKYVISSTTHQKLAVIVRKDGTREIYAFSKSDEDQPKVVIRLDEDEARRVGAVLTGTYYGD